jgi:hypothetical protein
MVTLKPANARFVLLLMALILAMATLAPVAVLAG